MSHSTDKALRERAARVIPGGMYGHQAVGALPDGYPQFFARAEGPWLWDADGNLLLDLMCAYGPQLFGYGNAKIDRAYVDQMAAGDAMTGPSPLMVDLAEKMVSMIGHADWAMFCKNGSDATTMALMTARAHTGKNGVVRARGAYHGSQPWANPRPRGIAPGDQAGQHFCDYNDVASLEAAVKAAGNDLAAIFAAPYRHDVFVDQSQPDAVYARRARELADETGALLIVDDVRAGFRMARDCSWSRCRRRTRPVVLGQGDRQRSSDFGAGGIAQGARRGGENLRHGVVLVCGGGNGGEPHHAGADPVDRLSRAHRRDG